MRHYKPEYTFTKYKPYASPWKKFWSIFKRKKQKNIYPARPLPTYKVNPYKRKTNKPLTAGKIIIMILLILIIAWVGLLVYLPYFRINNIEFTGLTYLNQNELQNYIKSNFLDSGRVIPVNDYFLVSIEKIQQGLMEKFSAQSITVEKVFQNTLKINVVEKKSALIYDNGQKYYLLDSGGSVIKYLTDVDKSEFQNVTSTSSTLNTFLSPSTANNTVTNFSLASSTTDIINTSTIITEHIPDYKKINNQFGSYPIIYDRRGLTIAEKQINILSADFINFISSWYTDLPKQGIQPEYLVLDNLNSGILIQTNKSWNIFVQPNNDYTTQLNNLITILKTIKPKQYLDLRFADRVYWK